MSDNNPNLLEPDNTLEREKIKQELQGSLLGPLQNALITQNQENPSRILVIDDDTDVVVYLEQLLRLCDFEVASVTDSSQTFSVVRHWKPDLIITDYMMPGLDGFKLSQMLKERSATSGIPIIILSARSDLPTQIKGFESGATDYIGKPFKAEELIARVSARLKERGTLKTMTRVQTGHIISIFSLQGGIGKSSLATNLALSTSKQQPDQPVALIEMNFISGMVGLMLNLPRNLTWGELAKENRDELSDLVLHHYFPATEYENLKVLLAPHEPQLAELIDTNLTTKVFSYARRHFPITIVDTPATYSETTINALDESDLIFLMMSQDIRGTTTATKTLETFEALGYETERLVLVCQKTPFAQPGSDKMECRFCPEIIKNRNNHRCITLSSDPKNHVESLNIGKPLVVLYPDTTSANETRKIAKSILRWRKKQLRIQGNDHSIFRTENDKNVERKPKRKRNFITKIFSGN